MTDDDRKIVDRLKEIRDAHWKHHQGMYPHYLKWSSPEGKFTDEEWKFIKNAIKKLQLPCSMTNCGMGFSIGFYMYEPIHIPGITPDGLMLIVPQFFEWDEKFHGKESWNKQFKEFSKFTHSEKNRELLKQGKLEEPRTQGYYEY